MIRNKKNLIIYQLILCLFATSVSMGLIFRPETGWMQWAQDKTAHMVQTKSQTANPFFDQTPATQLFYQIDAALDDKNSIISGKASVSIPAPPDSSLMFYLFPYTLEPIKIQRVQIHGKDVPFTATADQLSISGLEKGAPVTVQIDFSTRIPAAGTRLGQKDGVWSLTYWYPILGVYENGAWIPRPSPRPFGDPYLMDLAKYKVRLQHPPGWNWYTSGVQSASLTQQNGFTTTEWQADSVRSFALIGGAGWQETRWKTPSGVDVTVAARSADRLPALKTITAQAMSTYTSLFGQLAASSFAVLDMPEGTVYAHEYPNLALFSNDIWNWPNGEHWIAHEIAHAWWFTSVGTHKAVDPWLDEGLTDYAAYLYLETQQGSEAYNKAMESNWSLFRDGKSYAPHQFGAAVHVDGRGVDSQYADFDNEADYYYLVYLRPVLMYDDLRKTMGNQKFFAFLKQFYLKNVSTTTTRGKLEEALQQVDPSALPRLKMWLDMPNKQLLETFRSN